MPRSQKVFIHHAADAASASAACHTSFSTRAGVSLVGAATSIIFVMKKVLPQQLHVC